MHTNKTSSLHPAARTALLAGLVAGTCDILAAIIVYALILGKTTPLRLLQGLASALIGKTAYSGGVWTALMGLLMHYCIAMTWATFFVLVYPRVPFLRRYAIVGGLLYGVIVFIVMNAVVLPVIGYAPFKFVPVASIRQCVILMVCVGLPISLVAKKYYSPVRLGSQGF